jgi:proteasome lid subunit RPN8/RPN11
MGSITLPRHLVDEMVEHARAEYPNEACGLIAGQDGAAIQVLRMTNADASPVSYRLDPKEQLHAFDELDEKGWDLFAIFHSHTHSEAFPSETDRRLAFYPEARYVILSLRDRASPDVRAFRIDDGEVAEEEVTVA